MAILLFLCLLSQEPRDIIYLREEVTIELDGEIQDTYEREIFFDKKELRIDEPGSQHSYLIRTDPAMIIVLNHDRKEFSYGLVKHDRNLIRPMLMGLGEFASGKFKPRDGAINPTGLKRKISQWQCQEFAISYPSRFGVSTKIWCTNEYTIMSKTDLKMLWYAIIGGSPSHDVSRVVSQFFKDIPGVPIQFVSKIEQQGATVVVTSRIVTMEKRQIADENFFAIPTYQVVIPSARDQ